MAQPVDQWFKSMPLITKTYFVSALVTTALVSFGMLHPSYIYLDFQLVFKKFQLWRLLTSFMFFGKFSLNFVFVMFLLVRYTYMLEAEHFIGNRGKADMTFMMLFCMILLMIIKWLVIDMPFPGLALVFSLLYYWSRTAPYRPINFWGFPFQAWQFPFVMVVVDILIGASPVFSLIGIAVGHTFYFLKDIVPKAFNKTVIWTPNFMYNLFDQQNVAARGNMWQRSQGHRL